MGDNSVLGHRICFSVPSYNLRGLVFGLCLQFVCILFLFLFLDNTSLVFVFVYVSFKQLCHGLLRSTISEWIKGIEVSANGRVCVCWRKAVKLLASVSCRSMDGVALLCGQLDSACSRGTRCSSL